MRYSRRWTRSGTSLVEVLAAIAILGGVLAAMLAARARYTRQYVQSQRILRATTSADRLLTEWWGHPETIPEHEHGALAGTPEFSWKTEPLADTPAGISGTRVVRLSIFDEQKHADGARPPVVQIDLLLPVSSTINASAITDEHR